MHESVGWVFVGALALLQPTGAWAAGNDFKVPLPGDLEPEPSVVTIVGTLSFGETCPVLRADDGREFALVISNRGGARSGDHARIRGHYALASICASEKAIVVDTIQLTAGRDFRER